VAVLVSKFDGFGLIFSVLQFHNGRDPVPFTARKEALILSAKKDYELKAMPLCYIAVSSL